MSRMCIPFTHPLVMNFFRQVEAFEFPLTFDISSRIGERYGLYDDEGLPQLQTCLKTFPKLTIIGHGPAFWDEIGALEPGDVRGSYIKHPVHGEGALYRIFREYPNMWADLSAGSGYYALSRDPENAAKFINEFQDKLCFGTDICYADQKLPLADFLRRLNREGRISDDVLDKVSNRNIRRLLRLDAKP